MPLKHATETLLVAVLALLTLGTGFVLAGLPPLPSGLVPGLILLLITIAYPLFLYPMLRRNRADHLFRVLHFTPALLVLFWLIGHIAALRFPQVLLVPHLLTWSWSLMPVALIFFLLLIFCLHVIRRREVRLPILAFLFVPFAAAALALGSSAQPRKLLASVLPGYSQQSSAGSAVTGSASSAVRSRPLAMGGSRSSAPFFQQMSASSRPANLPHAGPGLDLLILTMVAGYCGVLHERARRRIEN